MKKYLLFATAALALASCTNETYLGSEEDFATVNGERPISFGFDVPAATRADATGATAATALGNQFLVYAEKGETDGSAPITNGSTTHQLVFPNYQVNYAASTANTTTSNTKDWEYVGYTHTPAYQSNVQTKDGSAAAANASDQAQTIKYWDFSASNYVYTAVSAQQSDITNGYVKFVKNTSGATVYDKGYTVTLRAEADPTKLYFSDRQVIDQTGAGADRTAVNKYGGNVTLKFRNGISQIRVGMYETIPGWSVTINKFYYVNDATPTFPTMTAEGTDKFYANVPNLLTTDAATLTVTYINSGARLNQPTIAVSGTNHNYIALGGANATATGLKADALLATTNTTPTYNETSGAYTPVFPQETNNKTLKLKIDYTLTAPVTHETIKVIGATAEVPAEYLRWKPNYKYTYLFKISDNTNGVTNPALGPAGLYPITFDAVEVVAEDGLAEYITTVSEPTITTFGVNSSTGKYVVGGSEYAAGSDIYAAFMENSAVITPTATNYKVYTVTTSDATNFPITEASVAEALEESPTGTAKIACTAYTTNVSIVTKVPGEDGVDIDPMNAVKMQSVAAGTYAIEYTASAAWTGTYTKVYKVIKVTAAP